MFDTIDFYHSLIGMPLIRVEIKGWYELQTEVMEHGGKLLAPITNCGMRYLDIESNLKN